MVKQVIPAKAGIQCWSEALTRVCWIASIKVKLSTKSSIILSKLINSLFFNECLRNFLLCLDITGFSDLLLFSCFKSKQLNHTVGHIKP
jgi:hypothetical protein